MNEQEQEEFEQRQALLDRHLVAARQCTLPLVRARVISEISMAIALQQELCRRTKIPYTPPTIPGPKKPELRVQFPSVVLQQGPETQLTNIVSKRDMTSWQRVIFCFFAGVRFTRFINVSTALLETEWDKIEETAITFNHVVSLATLQQVPEYGELFRHLEPIQSLENMESLTSLHTHFPMWSDGKTFAIASNLQLTILLWACNNEHLCVHTNMGEMIGVMYNENTNVKDTLNFMQQCANEKFDGFLVKKKKVEKGK